MLYTILFVIIVQNEAGHVADLEENVHVLGKLKEIWVDYLKKMMIIVYIILYYSRVPLCTLHEKEACL